MQTAIRLGDQIDAFRGATNEDDLARIRSMKEALYFGSGIFKQLRRALAQLVYTAVDIGVIRAVQARDRVDHGLRFLRGGGVIQVDQGFTVNCPAKNREVLPDPVRIERGCQK